MDSFKKRFSRIQTNLKAPKNLKNTFGNYNYRNAEGILEASKPFLEAEHIILLLNDEVTAFGERLFVKATAMAIDTETTEHIQTTALAEIDNHKGMSADQCVGCASSYARKYALNGLFLLDDTKDEDSDEFAKEKTEKAKVEPPKQNPMTDPNTPINQVQEGALLKRIGDDTRIIDYILNVYKIASLKELNIKRYEEINRKWDSLVKAVNDGSTNQQPAQKS